MFAKVILMETGFAIAFFFEAIFLGVYLYGWDRVKPWVHWWTGVGVWLSGTLSGIFVVTANAWMNAPTGFTLDASGRVVDVDPLAAMFNPAWFGQTLHMTVAAFLATGMLVAGIHARMLLREPNNDFHRKAMGIAFAVGGMCAVLQPLTGHSVGETLAHTQPIKLAAMEAHWETQRGAPFTIGGWPDEEAEETHWAIEIPYLLSFLAYGDIEAEVKGLKEVPPEDRPPVAVTHIAYQIMLATAGVMGGTTALGALLWLRRRRLPLQRWFLWLLVLNAPMGMIGIEAGWTATEVGRQPWIIQGVMRTSEAVSPMPGLVVPFLMFSGLYVVLGLVTLSLLRRQFDHSPYLETQEARDAS